MLTKRVKNGSTAPASARDLPSAVVSERQLCWHAAMLTTFATLVLVMTALWHAIAGVYFTFRPGFTIAIYTHERPVNRIAQELLRFLGALNWAVVLLAVVLA